MGNTEVTQLPTDIGQYIDHVLDGIEEKEANSDDSHIVTVTIDGNMGAGKTTLIRQMAEIDGVQTMEEPMVEWNEVLSSFYRNPKEYAFQLGLRTLAHFMNVDSKIREIKQMNGNVDGKENKPRVIIVERNARTQMLAFQETAKENGFLDEEQMSVLRSIYAMISIDFEIRIFVQTSPETCLERIKKRAREYEDIVSMDVLQKYHQKMVLCHSTLQQSECRYKAIIDGEQTQEKIKQNLLEILKDREGNLNEFEK